MVLLSWIASTYITLPYALLFFCICTTLDTKTRIEVNAKLKGIRFNPLKKIFWIQISTDGLRDWFRKVFKEYILYVIIAFALDALILKGALKFNVFNIKLDIPTCVVLVFSFTEIWSIFETREEIGRKNWLKTALTVFSGFLPAKWHEALNKSKILKNKQDNDIENPESNNPKN